MSNHNKNTNGTGPELPMKTVIDILNRTVRAAEEMYHDADPSKHCYPPIMTACRLDGSKVVMPLKPVSDERPDPEVVEAARSVAMSHQSDYVIMLYPVNYAPDRENDESPLEFGVLVEIQPKGQCPLMKMTTISRQATPSGIAPAMLPVRGRIYGVRYPHLLHRGRVC